MVKSFGERGGRLSILALTVHSVCTIEKAMNVFRYWSLQWCKRNLVKEFVCYTDNKFMRWRDYRKEWSKHLVIWRDAIRSYEWSYRGLATYSHGWKNRILYSQSEWMKGSDSIVRALRFFWWEWEDGSAPFYWRWTKWY